MTDHLLYTALKAIAHGTKTEPQRADLVQELLRIDRIACEALAKWEATNSAATE